MRYDLLIARQDGTAGRIGHEKQMLIHSII